MEGTTSKNAKLLATAGFLFITMIWGGSFVVMKNSVDLVPPSYLLALRFTLAAAFMAALIPSTLTLSVSSFNVASNMVMDPDGTGTL